MDVKDFARIKEKSLHGAERRQKIKRVWGQWSSLSLKSYLKTH